MYILNIYFGSMANLDMLLRFSRATHGDDSKSIVSAHFFLAQSGRSIYSRIIGLKVISIPDPPLLPVAGALEDVPPYSELAPMARELP